MNFGFSGRNFVVTLAFQLQIPTDHAAFGDIALLSILGPHVG
jgi:hypothetical protein